MSSGGLSIVSVRLKSLVALEQRIILVKTYLSRTRSSKIRITRTRTRHQFLVVFFRNTFRNKNGENFKIIPNPIFRDPVPTQSLFSASKALLGLQRGRDPPDRRRIGDFGDPEITKNHDIRIFQTLQELLVCF